MLDQVHSQYPIVANAQLVDESNVQEFMETLFSRVLWKPTHFINLRGIGEKGTEKEGKFHHDEWLQPGMEEFPDDHMVEQTIHHVKRWAQHHIAAFVVPAVMKAARGTSENVELMTCVVVDLDTGDTNAKASWIDQHIGRPTMAVLSGGTTEAGTPKMHLYWVLDDPEADIGAVVEIRHILAEKVGGDLQFGRGTPSNPLGRAHQPIRIGGSVHAKHGRAAAVRVPWVSGGYPDFHELAYRVRQAPNSPWYAPGRQSVNGFDFGPTKNHQPMDMDALLVEPVLEGGEGADSRWGRFNSVAGFQIGLARKGEITIEQARADTYGWMLSKMAPAWPDARFDREWLALLNRDIRSKGEITAAPVLTAAQLQAEPEKIRVERRLENWAVHLWTQEKAPPRAFVVRGLVQAGEPHLFVAEGGAGKTFSTLDLALKVASKGDDDEFTWLGMPIERAGTVVVLTTEDSKDELHRRFESMDPDGLRFRAGRRLIVMPTANSGGGFTMASRQKDGTVRPSQDWSELLAQLRLIPDLALVVIDTLNSTLHGEENSSTVIGEYVKMVQPICGERGAALMLTHHIRKPDPRFPIKTPDDMFAAIRGSSALPASFRAVLGMWHTHDWGKRMEALDLEPKAKRLWSLAVVKANNPEMVEGVRHLLRQDTGLLEDVTERVLKATTSMDVQRPQWFLAAIREAAMAGHPYECKSKQANNHPIKRRDEMHPMLHKVGHTGFDYMIERLLGQGEIVRAARAGATSKDVLDTPDGPFATNRRGEQVAKGAMPRIPWEQAYRWCDVDLKVVPMGAPKMVLPSFSAPISTDNDGETE